MGRTLVSPKRLAIVIIASPDSLFSCEMETQKARKMHRS